VDELTRQLCRGPSDLVGLSTVFGGNFGDLLGPYLFEKIALTEPKLFSVNDKATRDAIDSDHYLIVGSILKHVTAHADVWGIGIMHAGDSDLIRNKVRSDNIHAVRGPLSLYALMDVGILDSGDGIALGDPALLLPLVYSPCVAKKYRLGIIPHHTEYEETYERFAGLDDTCVITVGGLGEHANVERVIDQILSCEGIASSSLHGVIVAHAYNIPASWCNFSSVTKTEAMGTTRLKFYDYYGSVELDVDAPLDVTPSSGTIPGGDATRPDHAVIASIQQRLLRNCPFNVLNLTRGELGARYGSSYR
jgi:pyruvyltransferase